MKERIIKCGTNGELHITETDKAEGMKVVLVDEKNVPCARYEFEEKKLTHLVKITYQSKRYRIVFIGITPSSKYELLPCNNEN